MFKNNELSELDFELAKKWEKAGKELNIDIVSPFEIKTDKGVFVYAVLIKDFAHNSLGKGCLFRVDTDPGNESCGDIWEVAKERGYLVTNISEAGIEMFDINTAKHTCLESYFYIGDLANKPSWYTGKYCK